MPIKISRIIQGCMTMGAWGKQLGASEFVKTIDHCVDQGITTFDHADIYGDYTTERTFGDAFAKARAKRENVQFISKCGIQYVGNSRPENTVKHYRYDADYIVWSAEKSLKDLQTDYLDILLLHRPSPLMQADEVSTAIEKLKKEGKVLDFGVSNFTPSQTDLISKEVAINYNQIEFSLTALDAMTDGSLDYMQVKDIVPMCWSPLGALFKEESPQTIRLANVLNQMAEKYNADVDQVTLAFILKHPANIHPVIGTTNLERISKSVKALEIDLELQDWFMLWEASMGNKVA